MDRTPFALFVILLFSGCVEKKVARQSSASSSPASVAGRPLSGTYDFRSGASPADISIEVAVRQDGAKYALEFQGARLGGGGAAPEGSGIGSVHTDGVFHFAYEDSFFNKGTGTFRQLSRGRYELSIDITDVQDSRCMSFYGVRILKRDDARDRQKLADEAEMRRLEWFARAPWPAAVKDLPTGDDTAAVEGFRITTKDSPDQSGEDLYGRRQVIAVQNLKTQKSGTITAPCVGIRILTPAGGWPRLEVWSRSGSEFCRSLYLFHDGRYQCVRQDRFTRFARVAASSKVAPATIPGRDDALYFVATEPPLPE